MRVAIYSRKSKLTSKGESIENQVQMCKEYALEKLNVAEEIKVYEDEGFSGGNIDRPQFQKMLQDARNKKFDVLICYRLDRISRNVSDFSALIDELQDLNINFVSIKEQFDTTTPMGRAMMYIASVFAQLERETIAERVRDNMLQLATTGRWLGGIPPLGFASERVSYIDAEYKERSLVKLKPVKEEMKLVELFYDKCLKLGSVHQVRKYLMLNNIKTKNDKYYSLRALAAILRNPAYVKADDQVIEYLESKGIEVAGKDRINNKRGILIYNKTNNKGIQRDYDEWIAAVAKHNGIISSEKWLAVQNIIDNNSKVAPRTGTSEIALLSGLIRCAKCGSPMNVTYGQRRKNGEIPHYYVCSLKNVSQKTKCDNPNAPGIDTDNTVIKKLLDLSVSKEALLKELDRLRKNNKQPDNRNILMKLKNAREKLLNEINNLVGEVSKSATAAKYIIPQIEQKDEEVKKLDKQIAQLENKQKEKTQEEENLDLVVNNILNFGKIIDNLSNWEKKAYLKTIIDKVYWDGNARTVQIKLLSNIDMSQFHTGGSSERNETAINLYSKLMEGNKYLYYPEETLGQKIRKQRFLGGLTAEELGRLCGITKHAVYSYESDLGKPRHWIMKRIIDVFDVNVDYFEDEYYSFVLSPNYTDHLKKWRRGLKVNELEKILGVSYTAYREWEKGKIMNRRTFKRIRDKLGI